MKLRTNLNFNYRRDISAGHFLLQNFWLLWVTMSYYRLPEWGLGLPGRAKICDHGWTGIHTDGELRVGGLEAWSGNGRGARP